MMMTGDTAAATYWLKDDGPSTYFHECVAIERKGSHIGWTDVDCDNNENFICEIGGYILYCRSHSHVFCK